MIFMTYNFEQFKGPNNHYDGIYVGKNITVISKQTKERLNADFVDIGYDKEQNAISLFPKIKSDNVSYKIQSDKKNNSHYIHCSLYKVMQTGRYYFKEISNWKHIFVMEK